jgi:hypothetical protein
MAAVTLTPDQQTALDAFESSASDAAQAATDATTANATLLAAQQDNTNKQQAAVSTHVDALAKAQAFVDLMVPPTTAPATPMLAKPK